MMLAAFGEFTLCPERGLLWRRGRPVPIQSLPLRVLVALARAEGAIVTHSEMAEFLWPDRIVTFDRSLHTAVRKARRALGDDARKPALVACAVGRGYRLMTPVVWTETRTHRQHRSGPAVAASACIAVGLALTSALLLPSPEQSATPGVRQPAAEIGLPPMSGAPVPDQEPEYSPRSIRNNLPPAAQKAVEDNLTDVLSSDWEAGRADWERQRDRWSEQRRAWVAERPVHRSG